MENVKILYLKRTSSDFSESEKEINLMLEKGWKLISVVPDPLNQFKLIVTFIKENV